MGTIKKNNDKRFSEGSALILTIVLTSLLAIVGVMFLMAARMNSMSVSSISVNKELNAGVDAVVTMICSEMAMDVPGVREPNQGGEYYDYAGFADKWLASLEPYEKTPGNFCWGQISDINGFFEEQSPDWKRNDIEIEHHDANNSRLNAVIAENKRIELDSDGRLYEQFADADGDGVGDSKWIELGGMNSAKGRRIYAAVRVIDNGGMLNVNTGYMFDHNDVDLRRIDGSRQSQINLAELSRRGSNDDAAERLQKFRCTRSGQPTDIFKYDSNFVERFEDPNVRYSPFDLGDEMQLRYRYILSLASNSAFINTPSYIETLWTKAFNWGKETPFDPCSFSPTDPNKPKWYYRVCNVSANKDHYDYRHIATTCNIDRIINPDGGRMLNINDSNLSALSGALTRALRDVNTVDANQLAVNLIDYTDADSNVAALTVGAKTYYGFEAPCIYISEIAHHFIKYPAPSPDPNIYRSYAIELVKSYSVDIEPNNWQLVVKNTPNPITIPIVWSSGTFFHLVMFNNANPDAALSYSNASAGIWDTNMPPNYEVFVAGSVIELQRPAADSNTYITVDRFTVPSATGTWLPAIVDEDEGEQSIQRDITPGKCIRRLWDANSLPPTLGATNSYTVTDDIFIQEHPANRPFINIAQAGQVFRKNVYQWDVNDSNNKFSAFINLTEPNYGKLLSYLTVLDPSGDLIDNDGDGTIDEAEPNKPAATPELKIAGRININTAPWYVIGQLPWMRYGDSSDYDRAKKLCEYRDKFGAFKTIASLLNVTEMRNLSTDANDNLNTVTHKGPDLTTDTARDDIEERDLILARISNLVTVRSDVFTAYILVRLGVDGPQKRMIAILDRSNVYSVNNKPVGKVKIVALHPVPDPR